MGGTGDRKGKDTDTRSSFGHGDRPLNKRRAMVPRFESRQIQSKVIGKGDQDLTPLSHECTK